jgi:hypothetical protein
MLERRYAESGRGVGHGHGVGEEYLSAFRMAQSAVMRMDRLTSYHFVAFDRSSPYQIQC